MPWILMSDDDFQRHNAHRHHREGSGQDLLGQQVVHRGSLYTVTAQQTRSDGPYCRLKSLEHLAYQGPLDGQWVKSEQLFRGN